jgi:hypothetical protein
MPPLSPLHPSVFPFLSNVSPFHHRPPCLTLIPPSNPSLHLIPPSLLFIPSFHPFFSSLPSIPPHIPPQSPPSLTSIRMLIIELDLHCYLVSQDRRHLFVAPCLHHSLESSFLSFLHFLCYYLSKSHRYFFSSKSCRILLRVVALDSHSRPKQSGKRKSQHCHLWARFSLLWVILQHTPNRRVKKL